MGAGRDTGVVGHAALSLNEGIQHVVDLLLDWHLRTLFVQLGYWHTKRNILLRWMLACAFSEERLCLRASFSPKQPQALFGVHVFKIGENRPLVNPATTTAIELSQITCLLHQPAVISNEKPAVSLSGKVGVIGQLEFLL